jgi:hypothetical protein
MWGLRLSSNLLILVLALLCGACGVKGEPASPEGADIPSLMQDYPDIQLERPLNETPKRKPRRR